MKSGRKAPRRRKPIARSPIKRKPRKPSEYARCYGSRERVAWIKSLPCMECGGKPSDPAHTATGGMGRKADASTIAPLCRRCHTLQHAHGWSALDNGDIRFHIAALYDLQWHARQETKAA